MLPLGLSTQEQKWFHEALVSHQRVHTRLALMDLEHRHLGDLTDLLDDGQVDLIADGNEATRTCSLTLFDPHRRSTLDGASAGTAGVHADRMLRVTRSWFVPQMGRWVDVPMFTGPVVKAERSGHTLSVECQGKEMLANTPGWQARVWAAGLTRVGVARSILAELTGERRFDFPSVGDKSARLPKELSLSRNSKPWQHVLILARSMGWQAFYDGRGTARLRALYSKPVWDFRDGEGGSVLSTPEVVPSSEEDDLANTFQVLGVKSKNAQVSVTEYLPAWHARSPQNLGRHGVDRNIVLIEENEEIRTWDEARKVARQLRDEHMGDAGKVTWEGLIVPHLEPLDMVQLDAGGITQSTRLREASFSLRGSTATYGYTTVLKRRRSRRFAR